MIREALDSIKSELSNDLYKEVARNSGSVLFRNIRSGSFEGINLPRPDIKIRAGDIASFADLIVSSASEFERRPKTFVSESVAVCVLGSPNRGDTISLPLEPSSIFGFLKIGIASTPDQVVRQLRREFFAAEEVTNNIVEALSMVKFESASASEHMTRPSDEGVSRSLRAKASGAAAIPESFSVTFEMYPCIAEQIPENGLVTVEMSVFVDPSAEKIAISAMPGSIRAASVAATRMVANAIKQHMDRIQEDRQVELETTVSDTVYLGTP